MANTHEEVVRRLFAEIWNAGHLKLANELFASNCVHDIPMAPEFGTGPEAHKDFVALLRSGLHDFHVVVDEVTTRDETVTTRWSAFGKHLGPLMGIPPSGRPVDFRGTSEFQFTGLQISGHQMDWESDKLLMQLAGKA